MKPGSAALSRRSSDKPFHTHCETVLLVSSVTSSMIRPGLSFPLLLATLLAGAGRILGAEMIEAVRVTGTQRLLDLETRAGEVFQQARIARDVRQLWDTGWFEDIRVQTEPAAAGIELTFHVAEKRRFLLREVQLRPTDVKAAFEIPRGTPVDASIARKAARDLQQQLEAQGDAAVKVTGKLVPVDAAQADLHLSVERGPTLRVREVQFSGPSAYDKALRKQLRALRPRRVLPGIPGLWGGWKLQPFYQQQLVEADVERLRSYYLAQGYLDAGVRIDRVDLSNNKASITLAVDPGPRSHIGRIGIEGLTADDDGNNPSATVLSSLQELCSCLRQTYRTAEAAGKLDFSARVDIEKANTEEVGTEDVSNEETPRGAHLEEQDPVVNIAVRVDPGPTYTVGRISFHGNTRLRDETLRRALRLQEGEVLDVLKLRASVNRLSRMAFLAPLTEDRVRITSDPVSRTASIAIHVQERKRGRWSVAGPLTPLSGPLNLLLDSRLPPWGRGILELSTFAAFMSVTSVSNPLWQVLGWEKQTLWRPVFGITRPFLPGQGWRSGFMLSPQLGWQATSLAYASTQARERLQGVLVSGGPKEPSLAVPVYHGSSFKDDPAAPIGSLLCEPRPGRWAWLGKTGRFAIQWLLTGPA